MSGYSYFVSAAPHRVTVGFADGTVPYTVMGHSHDEAVAAKSAQLSAQGYTPVVVGNLDEDSDRVDIRVSSEGRRRVLDLALDRLPHCD